LANEHGGFVTVPQPRKNQSHRKVYGNVHGQQEPFVYNKRQLPDIAGEGECRRLVPGRFASWLSGIEDFGHVGSNVLG